MSKGHGEDEKPGKEVDCRLMARKVEDSEERRAMRAPREAGVFKKGYFEKEFSSIRVNMRYCVLLY